jgi:xylulokinase
MNNEARYIIGMDCGTTNIKAVVLSNAGEIVAEASRPSKPIYPGPGMHEQDANEWWKNASDIFKDLMIQLGPDQSKYVAGVCISSHTVSMLPVDKNGAPLRNALIYQDERSNEERHEITRKVGTERFIKIVGGQPSVAFLPNKILWFKKNEPQLFAKTKYVMQASSYINYKLTDVFSSDIDQATRTQCLDISTLQWSDVIGDAIDVDLNVILPPLYNIDDVIGTVTKQACLATGIPEGTPVLAGCSDAIAAMQAPGMSRLGDVGESSGTSSLVFVGGLEQSAPDVPVVTRPCPIDGIPWVYDAPITTTGAAIKWYIENMAGEERNFCAANELNIYNYLNELALKAEPGCSNLFFFPYLMGERAPLWNDHARGMFIGLSMTTTRADLIRSVFEGTAYALRHVIETVRESGAKADSLRICGGGAKSRTWNMIKASVLNMPVYVLDDTSGDVPVGDCLIAGHKLGVFPDLKEAADKIIKIKEVIMPDPEWVKMYDKLYPFYISMYQHIDGDLDQLKKVNG